MTTRQANWQARMIAEGKCRICGKQREKDDPQMCPEHRAKSRAKVARK